ncbi:IS66 family transposase zinc-finger binding domain-containing protein [Citrobacter werkmanii]|uniref:IS66 family transposase zinc-finger binding domain-containing protein n=1 Tax=Citrobacter werkmanii TaxID=67827 RepID=UPI003BA84228
MLPGMWWCAELPGEDAAEQLELMRSAFRVIRTVREKHACTQCDAIVQAPRLHGPSSGVSQDRGCWPAC